MSDSKTCPYCGELIKSVAVKCKHCQSDLEKKSNSELSDIEVKKSNEYISGIKKVVFLSVAAVLVVFVAYILNSETEKRYVSQTEFGRVVGGFTNKYTNAYQFVNEISATKIRQERKSVLEKTPTNFIDWKVVFYAASTDSSGIAKVVFNDFNQRNIFYIARLTPNDIGYNRLAGVSFGTTFYISGNFLTSLTSNDYFVEESLTEKGSMLAPEFKIKIISISNTKSAQPDNVSTTSSLNNSESKAQGFQNIDPSLDKKFNKPEGVLYKSYSCDTDFYASNRSLCLDNCKPNGKFFVIKIDVGNSVVDVTRVDSEGKMYSSNTKEISYKNCNVKNSNDLICNKQSESSAGENHISTVRILNGHVYYNDSHGPIGCYIKY